MEQLTALSPEQRELFDLLSQRARPETAPPEPIAVVGIGCRFPGGANDPDSLWQLLTEGRDAVREVPRERWDIDAFYDPNPDAPGKMGTRSGGFLDDVDRFDAAFFGISPREATWMDPQQRVLLEVCWQALENAGIAPDSLAGSRTGVFGGLCTGDYFRWVYADAERVSAYAATGTLPSTAAGRVSYLLGLQGPCIAVDTACSSSLVAIHLACQSLRQKECEMALAGGVSLILSPETSINFTKARMLAPDGRCKTFDATADGYGRGEGCGMLVLKSLSAAKRDGDTIWGAILGSAVNQDGRSNGLTAPNPIAQEALLRAALAAAHVKPGDVSYIEAHGTGTPLGDPIEIGALAAVLGRGRPKDRALRIGTVKTNIGHLEIAAGVAGLIKTLLCMRHRQLVPNLHFRQLNPEIAAAIGDLPIEVCQRNEPWEGVDGRLIAGVSSFGFGGTNAHVIVEGGWPSQAAPSLVPSVGNGLRAVPPHLPLPPGEGRGEGRGVALGLTMAIDAGSRDDGPLPNPLPKGEGINVLPLPPGEGRGEGASHPSDVDSRAYSSPHAPREESASAERHNLDAPHNAKSEGIHHAERDAYCTLQVLCLSAKTPAALAALAHSYLDFLSHIDADIADICYTANTARAHFDHRLAVVGGTCRELAENLAKLAANGPDTARPDPAAAPPTNGDALHPRQIAERYLQGVTIDWRAVYGSAPRRRIALPTYPFQRERYWLPVGQAFQPDEIGANRESRSPTSNAVDSDSSRSPVRLESLTYAHPLLGHRLRTASRDIIFESHLTPSSPGWLADHVVRGTVIVPGAAYVELALTAARLALPPSTVYCLPSTCFRLLSTSLPQFLPLDSAGRLLQTALTPQGDGGWQFTCSSADPEAGPDAAWTLHATGTIASGALTDAEPTPTLDEARSHCARAGDVAEHYRMLASAGLEYGPTFRGIAELWSGDRAALARVLVAPTLRGGEFGRRQATDPSPSRSAAATLAEYTLHPALLDACLQTFVAALSADAALFVPVGWESFDVLPRDSVGNGLRAVPQASDTAALPLPPGEGWGEGSRLPLPPGEGRGEGEILPLPSGEGWGEGVVNLWAFAQLDDPLVARNSFRDEPSRPDELIGRLTIFDSAGAPLATWSGIRLKRLPRPAAERSAGALAPKENDVDESGSSSNTADSKPDGDGLLKVIHECAVRVLELPRGETIGPDDNLYDLGMDSIMATELLFHIEKALDCSLPMQAMAKSKTIIQIAEMVRSKRKDLVAK
jgi:acyl transferase domain-containing protein/acyl carrier protein